MLKAVGVSLRDISFVDVVNESVVELHCRRRAVDKVRKAFEGKATLREERPHLALDAHGGKCIDAFFYGGGPI